jgi:hypothetical protein
MTQAPAAVGHGATAGPWRGRLVWALIVLATVVALVSTLTTWVNRQALDTTSWVNASSNLLEDEDVRSALSVYLVNQLYTSIDVGAELEAQLPPDLKPLAPTLAAALRSPAENAVDRLLARPRVQELWREANRVAHERLIAVIEDKTRPGISTANGNVTLDVHELVTDLATQLGLPAAAIAKIPDTAGEITVLRSDQLSTAQKAVKAVKKLSVWLLILVLVLYGLAVYLARGARRVALRNIGWSVILIGIVLLVVRRVGGNYLVDALSNTSTHDAVNSAWLIGTEILGQIGWAGVGYGTAIVLGTVLAGPTRWATRARAWLAPTVNTQPLIVWGGVLAVFLLLIAWAPTHALRTTWGILILGALIAAGVYAFRRETLREFPGTARPG